MTRLIATALLTLTCSTSLFAADLSSDQKLAAKDIKIESLQIQVQVDQIKQAEAQIQAAQQALQQKAAALVEEFRKALKADKDEVFSWDTLTFTKEKK